MDRALEDENKGRLGIKECVEHGLVTPYDVLYEKEGEVVAQLKFAVLLLPSGPSRATLPVIDPTTAKSELALTDPALLSLLAQSAAPRKKSNKKRKAKAAAAAGAAATAAADGDDSDGTEDA
jgi:hypothetical protein